MLQLLHLFFVFFLPRGTPVSAAEPIGMNNTHYLESIIKSILPSNYNYQRPPDINPVKQIDISFTFLSLSQVVISKMEIEVEFMFIASWTDERLNPSVLKTSEEAEKLPSFQVPEQAAKKLWIPKLILADCKRCGIGKLTGPTTTLNYDWRTNRLMTLNRDTISFVCIFKLSYYPFDTHECRINIVLVEFISTIQLKLQDIAIPQVPRDKFIKTGMPTEYQFLSLDVNHSCSERAVVLTTNPDRCLQYIIRFERVPHSHLMLVYSPTTTIVLISWISFWLPIDTSAPRISLGMTSLLTLTTQFANAQKNLPPVAYIKSLDVWMLMCSFMVFSSLVEFTLAHIFRNPRKKNVQPLIKVKEEPKPVQQSTLSASSHNQGVSHVLLNDKPPSPEKKAKDGKDVNWLDAKARIGFPVVFVLFNIVYWSWSLTGDG